jgi:hypothetical protein
MREIRQSGSEGGAAQINVLSLPLSAERYSGPLLYNLDPRRPGGDDQRDFRDTLAVQRHISGCPMSNRHAREGGHPGFSSGFPPKLVPAGFRRGACGNAFSTSVTLLCGAVPRVFTAPSRHKKPS